MRSLTNLARSELLYPLHLVEGVFRAQVGVGRRGPHLYAALFGLLGAGAAALLLLRTLNMPAGIVVGAIAYVGGLIAAILVRAILLIFFSSEGVA